MKNYNEIQLENSEREKLQTFAVTSILSKLRLNVPSLLKYDDQYLMSEIWNQYSYLLRNYREGSLSRTSYCFKYAYNRTLTAIWNEYNNVEKTVSLDTLLKEPSYMKNETIVTPETEYTEKEDKIVINERIASVLSEMSPQDILIAQDYMYGMTLEQIGMKHKITKMAVLKRLRKYAK